MKLSKREPKHMGEVMSDIAERYDKLTKTKKMNKEELKDILWSFDDYCKRMEKIYENPRPKQLLIESFISEYLN